MRTLLHLSSVTLFLVLVAACGGTGADQAGGNQGAKLEVATYRVLGPAATPARFALLAAALGLPDEARDPAGFVRFTDADRFLHVPTVALGDVQGADEEQTPFEAEGFDFDALAQIVVPTEGRARQLGEDALRAADLLPKPGSPYDVELTIAHARFEAVDEAGAPVADVELDTQLDGRFFLGGVPVVGPGAAVKIAFGPDEKVTHASYALRDVELGPMVEIIDRQAAEAEGAERLRGLVETTGADLDVQSRLVYYAPPLEGVPVQSLMPHYEIRGTFTLPGGASLPVRRIYLPATRLRVEVTLDTELIGREIAAQAHASGGTPPYRYEWWSNSTTAPTALTTASIRYEAGPGRDRPFIEVLNVRVTDANGFSRRVPGFILDVPPFPTADEPGEAREYGIEFIGTSQGLPGSAANAGGFRTTMLRDDPTARSSFFFGDWSAWEQDFKDPAFGGTDDLRVDAVDFAFYTGHANGDQWTFPGAMTDGLLHYNDARYGEGDLEWLVVAACGPLQRDSGGLRWHERWGPAFQGLHLFMGYQTVTDDNEREGRLLAEALLRGEQIRTAWFATAIEVQRSDDLVAVMGAYGDRGLTNMGDHWHGQGAVGPDIRIIRGYWMISSSC